MNKDNNELQGLSVEQINEIFKDIIEIEEDSILLSGPSCKSGTGDNCSSNIH